MSGPTDLGQTYRYRQTITDATGTPADAGTVVITITLPDGTTATPAVNHAGTGLYDIAYLTTQAGKHDLSGSATGGVLGTEVDVWEDVFTVETPLRMFISVDEAINHLRAAGVITSAADREQLRWLCMVASSAVEDDLGLVIAKRTITTTFDGGSYELKLQAPPRPAQGGSITIVTVVENGITLTSGDYVLRKKGWRLTRGTTLFHIPWWYGAENISVTYVAGCADPPRVARKVALNGVQRMWAESQQASHPALDDVSSAEAVFVAAGSLTPLEMGAYNSLRSVNAA